MFRDGYGYKADGVGGIGRVGVLRVRNRLPSLFTVLASRELVWHFCNIVWDLVSRLEERIEIDVLASADL